MFEMDSTSRVIVIACAAWVVITIAFVGFLHHRGQAFSDGCQQRGGHVKHISRDDLCLTDDGRILDL